MQVSERMGSLGLLTAGVAHEINNPLEGIENCLALLEREPLSRGPQKKYIEMVRYGFHRIRDIVRDLSSFARPAVSDGAADLAGDDAGPAHGGILEGLQVRGRPGRRPRAPLPVPAMPVASSRCSSISSSTPPAP